ncbi:MAG: ATP-dependent DNA helicase, partial [Gammaproteobacteria bacterium]
LLATVFPDQVACAENLVGEREVPDHPLVAQTLHDCLHEAMDIDGLERVLAAIAGGDIEVLARDLTEPSPLALEILAARPYSYLNDAPLEERRTQAVMARRWMDPETAADLGKLDVDAIHNVRDEAWPQARNADELHDALLAVGFLADAEIEAEPRWRSWLQELVAASRATCLLLGPASVHVAAERLPEFLAAFPGARRREPGIEAPAEYRKPWTAEAALLEILRDRLQALGPVTAGALAGPLGLAASGVEPVLLQLEAEGSLIRGRFTPQAPETEWCERRLLARIHRYTVNRLRREIEPVEARDFMRFLFEWQRVAPEARVEGPDAVAGIVAQLEGFEAPAAAWETEILPTRVNEYDPGWLDELSRAGRVVWTRIAPLQASGARAPSPVRTTPIVLASRRHLGIWGALAQDEQAAPLGASARAVLDFLAVHGASFFDEIADGCGLLRAQVEDALGEL